MNLPDFDLSWLPTLRDLPSIGSPLVSPQGARMIVERVTEIEPGRYVVAGKPLEIKRHRHAMLSNSFMFLWDGENA